MKTENGKLKKYKLSEYIDSFGDGIHGTPDYDEKGAYYFVNGNNLKEGKINITEDTLKVSSNEYSKIKRNLIPNNTILVSINGTLGNVALYQNENIALGKSACYLNLKDSSFRFFLRYVLETKEFKNYMNRVAGQSTIKNISPTQISEYEFFAPPLESQQKIAAVLSALDDKITLNRRMNTKLEQMAKRLYDHWFVQFDFPNADGKPYKSSGGKMEYNEVLKREIPAEWEVKSVNDISTSYRGVGYTADDEKSVSDKDVVLILRGNNISNNHIVYDGNTVYLDKSFVSEEQKINKYDIVMTMSSGSKEHVGKSAMFLFDSPHSYGAFCNKITPAKDCQFFLENYLHSEYFKKYIQITCSGTGINNLTNEHFDKAFFSFPDNEVLESFNQKINPIYEQIGVLEKENLRLMGLRDRLLPLLMNGQVQI